MPNDDLTKFTDPEVLTDLAEQAMTVMTTYLTEYGLKIIAAILIFIIGRLIVRLLTSFADRVMTRSGVDPTVRGFLHNIIFAGLLAFVILAALAKLGIQTASFVAVLGAAGLAVGLALQGSLSNFAAGVLLIMLRPLREGDYIEAGGTAGIVEKVMIFSTQFRTGDNKRIIVPNAQILGDNIVNHSVNPTRRIDFTLGVAYDSDLRKTKEVLRACVEARSELLKDEPIVIEVGSLGDSSINFIVRMWVNTPDYWPTFWALNHSFKDALDEAGIVIPFPQMDVHLSREAS